MKKDSEINKNLMINLKELGNDSDFKFFDKNQAIMGQCRTKDYMHR
jgi:hypothetical protein